MKEQYMFHKTTNKLLFVTISAVLIISTLFQSLVRAEDLIRVGGSGSGLGAMRLLAEAYERSHPGVKFKIFPSLGSSGGIKALLDGAIDIAISSRQLKDSEKMSKAIVLEYAKTPFIFITNSGTDIADLTEVELEKIYAGDMKTWPNGELIRPVLRPEADTDTSILKGISPTIERALKEALSRQGMIFAVTDQECAEKVENVKGSIGASTLTQIITEKRQVKVLSFNGIKPSLKALEDGSYPLYKRLNIVIAASASEKTSKFVDFVRSKTGRKILEDAGNITNK